MGNEIAEIEDKIKKLTATDFGKKHNVVLSLSQIEEIPMDSYGRLQELMRSGEARMRQYPLSTGAGIFTLISKKSESLLFYFVGLLTFLMPLAALILSFIYSWWFLLISLISFFTTRLGKWMYLHALFNRAANSEIMFCLLFCGNYITIELPGQGIIVRNP